MTTPPPGQALTAETVKLLVKLLDTLKPFAEVAETLKHCHVVEICEPTPDNPSRNIVPMPREWFERAGDDMEFIAIRLHADGVLSEGQASKLTGLDRVEVRKEVDRLASQSTAPTRGEGEDVEVKWFVSVGGGHYGPRPFDNEADALAHYDEEMSIPSYMGAGRKRHGSVVKVTTHKEVVRPLRAPTPPEPVASALADGESAGEPFMFAYENVDKPGEWRAFRQQIKRHDGSICPGRALYTHPPLVTAEAAAARIAELEADIASIRRAQRDVVRAEIQREGYEPISDAIDRATQAEARAERLADAVRDIDLDYMTSETHHPKYVLIPSERFAKLLSAAEALREPKSGGGE